MPQNRQALPSMVGPDIHHDNCFACGEKNPASLHVPSTFDPIKREVLFSYKIGQNHEGAPGHSHGGVLAAILDEAQGVLCHHLGHFVMTDNFYIKYHKATPLHETITIKAWLTAVRKRRLYTKAAIYKGDTGVQKELLVESKIRWYVIPNRLLLRKFDLSDRTESIPHISTVLKLNRTRAQEVRHSHNEKQKHKDSR